MAGEVKARKPNRFARIIEDIFFARYQAGDRSLEFGRDEIRLVATKLGIVLPLNVGDVIYSFRYLAALPERIKAQAPEGEGG